MSTPVLWAAWWVAAAGVVGAGSLLLERAARQLGLPGRGPWLLGLLATLLLPCFAVLRPAPGAAPVLPVAFRLPALEVSGGVAGAAVPVWLGLWLGASALVLVVLVRSHLSLRRLAKEWRRTRLEEGEVWVSESLGPAVTGWWRQRVVVPEWVLALPADLRALLLRHEREHARAGDARVVTCAYLAAVALPWNPFVWWQLHRLRHAVELDCDARVLRQGGAPHAYGSLLLEVGRRRSAQPLLATAFAERRTLLERRIRALAARGRRRPLRAAGFAVFGLSLLGTAYCMADPTAAPASLPVVAEPAAAQSGAAGGEYTFTPMTRRPELQNAVEVAAALKAAYPPLLRDAGISGQATVWLFISEQGVVQKSQLSRSSGYEALDEAALAVAATMRFAAARNGERAVPVWVEVPLGFSAPQ